jgi:hypothetical protein
VHQPVFERRLPLVFYSRDLHVSCVLQCGGSGARGTLKDRRCDLSIQRGV